MAFANDNFTDANGTNLSAHTSDSLHTWTQNNGSAVLINNNTIYSGQTTEGGFYYTSAISSGAEYDVQIDVTVGNSADVVLGPAGRIATGANTGYGVVCNGGSWRLYEVIGGTETSIGSYSGDSPTTTKTVLLQIRNATKKVFINGVERISSANNNITDAGRAGIFTYYTDASASRYADNWSASNVAATAVTGPFPTFRPDIA